MEFYVTDDERQAGIAWRRARREESYRQAKERIRLGIEPKPVKDGRLTEEACKSTRDHIFDRIHSTGEQIKNDFPNILRQSNMKSGSDSRTSKASHSPTLSSGCIAPSLAAPAWVRGSTPSPMKMHSS
jgi:hypothetical protein